MTNSKLIFSIYATILKFIIHTLTHTQKKRFIGFNRIEQLATFCKKIAAQGFSKNVIGFGCYRNMDYAGNIHIHRQTAKKERAREIERQREKGYTKKRNEIGQTKFINVAKLSEVRISAHSVKLAEPKREQQCKA